MSVVNDANLLSKRRENEKSSPKAWNNQLQHSPLIARICSSPRNSQCVYSNPIMRRNSSTFVRGKGFVSKSAGMESVRRCSGVIIPASTASRSQKNYKSRCFMRPWCLGFLATDSVDWLSM